MRKILLAALTLIALTTVSHARNVGCAVVLRMSDGYLNLRVGPGTDSPVITRLHPGNIVVLSSDYIGNWRRVSTRKGDLDGWISSRWIQWVDCPENSLPPAPVVVAPPPPSPTVVDGNYLLNACTGSDLSYCYGYLLSAADTMAKLDNRFNDCIAKAEGNYEIKTNQLKDVFIRWMQTHPQFRHLGGSELVGKAFRESWNCPAATTKGDV
jgi:SH3 domain-containing protein/Ssp1 endopeptidase immunity protein Rap1a